MSEHAQDLKVTATTLARLALQAFLRTDATLDLTPRARPRLSILLLVCNRAELTLGCLQALLAGGDRVPFELVVVDNGSTDETAELLRRLRGARVIRNSVNLGYPRGVNQAAALARSEYLLLLNNDAQVFSQSLDAGVAHLDAHADVGAVGGQVILLDGSLQEAGCSIARDGWTRQQGRGEPPGHPAFAAHRDVDYCSGVYLMTRRRLFHDLGGMDEDFSPGYFEDPDYCVRLWAAGWRVVYLPEVVVLHHENATSALLWNIQEQCRRNHARFVSKQAAWLGAQFPRGRGDLHARVAHDLFLKALVLLDGFYGAPAGALAGLVARLHSLDTLVTLCHTEAELPAAVEGVAEVVGLDSPADLGAFLEARAAYYDLVVFAGEPPAAASRAVPGGPVWVRWEEKSLTRRVCMGPGTLTAPR